MQFQVRIGVGPTTDEWQRHRGKGGGTASVVLAEIVIGSGHCERGTSSLTVLPSTAVAGRVGLQRRRGAKHAAQSYGARLTPIKRACTRLSK